MAVTWAGGNDDFVPWVVSAGPSHLRGLLCNFRRYPVRITPTFWELVPGDYTLTLGQDPDGDGKIDAVLEKHHFCQTKATQAPFSLPSRGPYTLTVSHP